LFSKQPALLAGTVVRRSHVSVLLRTETGESGQ
jgi:hypothetical protein